MGVLVLMMCFLNSAIPLLISLFPLPPLLIVLPELGTADVLKVSRLDNGVETLDSYRTGALGSLGSPVTSCKTL